MDVFEKNILSIEKKYPELVERIRAYDGELIELEGTKSGDYTFRYNGIYFHSRYNPREEASEQAKPLLERKYDWAVLSGLGCGYLLRELIKGGSKKIFVYEPSLTILMSVLKKVDVSDLFSEPNVYLFDMSEHMVNGMAYMIDGMDDLASYQTQPYKLTFPREILDCSQKIMNNQTRGVTLAKTEATSMLGWLENTIADIPHIITRPNIIILKLLSGIPLVIVGAGPSLKKNIHLLKELKGKALIIAAITAYKPLLKYGIMPDFIVAAERVDMQEYFTGGEDDKRVRLLLADFCHPDMFKKEVKGTYFFTANYNSLGKEVARYLKNDYLPQTGGSVTTVAFDFGVIFGFNPIILVGQDLAFSDEGKTHVDGGVYVDQVTTFDAETGRFNISEKYMTLEDEVKSSYNTLWLKGLNGKKVASKYDWIAFHQWFEVYMSFIKKEKVPIRIINATEGGAYIEGMEHITLREAIDSLGECTKLPKPLSEVLDDFDRLVPHVDFDGLIGMLQDKVQTLKEMRTLATAISNEAKDLKKKCKKNVNIAEFHRQVTKIKEMEDKLFAMTDGASFIWSALSSHIMELKFFLRKEPDKDKNLHFKRHAQVIAVTYENFAAMCKRLLPLFADAVEGVKDKRKIIDAARLN